MANFWLIYIDLSGNTVWHQGSFSRKIWHLQWIKCSNKQTTCQRCEKLDHHQIQCVKIMSKNDIFKIVPTLSGQKCLQIQFGCLDNTLCFGHRSVVGFWLTLAKNTCCSLEVQRIYSRNARNVDCLRGSKGKLLVTLRRVEKQLVMKKVLKWGVTYVMKGQQTVQLVFGG